MNVPEDVNATVPVLPAPQFTVKGVPVTDPVVTVLEETVHVPLSTTSSIRYWVVVVVLVHFNEMLAWFRKPAGNVAVANVHALLVVAVVVYGIVVNVVPLVLYESVRPENVLADFKTPNVRLRLVHPVVEIPAI